MADTNYELLHQTEGWRDLAQCSPGDLDRQISFARKAPTPEDRADIGNFCGRCLCRADCLVGSLVEELNRDPADTPSKTIRGGYLPGQRRKILDFYERDGGFSPDNWALLTTGVKPNKHHAPTYTGRTMLVLRTEDIPVTETNTAA